MRSSKLISSGSRVGWSRFLEEIHQLRILLAHALDFHARFDGLHAQVLGLQLPVDDQQGFFPLGLGLDGGGQELGFGVIEQGLVLQTQCFDLTLELFLAQHQVLQNLLGPLLLTLQLPKLILDDGQFRFRGGGPEGVHQVAHGLASDREGDHEAYHRGEDARLARIHEGVQGGEREQDAESHTDAVAESADLITHQVRQDQSGSESEAPTQRFAVRSP